MDVNSYKYPKFSISLELVYLIFFLLMTSFLQGQNNDLAFIIENRSDTTWVDTNEMESFIQDHLEGYRAMGYWDAQIELKNSELHSGHILASIKPGKISSTQNIHFSGIKEQERWYLNQEFLLGRDAIMVDQLGKAENRIQSLGYYLQAKRDVSVAENGDYHLNYTIKDHPEINVDALAAFNQSAGVDTISWFGHVNIQVPNLDGRGKSMRLRWKRLKTNSEQFSIAYEHPWIFNKPLKAVLKFGREVVDGNYQIVEGGIGLDWSLDWDRSLIFQYENHQSFITHAGALQNPAWQAIKRQMLGLGYRHSNLDRSTHQGFALLTLLDQQINYEPNSVRRFQLRLEAETALLYQVYLSQRIALLIQNQGTSEQDPSLLKALGGINSVRGYEEDFVRNHSIMSLQHDLHFPLGSDSQLLALIDLGVYNESSMTSYLTGYGLGLQLRTTRGPIQIIVASHKGVNLRNSFIHIEYSRGVSWIDQ